MEKLHYKTGVSSDEEIISKIVQGEKALFEVLIRRYNPLLYKIARTYELNHQDAEDMMQETHVAAYMQLKTFRSEASYKTWLTKILLHKCYHKLNYGCLKYEEVNNDLITENTMSSSPEKQHTEKMVINKVLAKVLETCLQHLPLPYRSVFVIREIEGFSVAETADLLQLTTTNVKVRLNRAKTLLQKRLEQFYTSAELFEFHLMYCDTIVKKVLERITLSHN